jgi:hypothetical protein
LSPLAEQPLANATQSRPWKSAKDGAIKGQRMPKS